MCFLTTGLLRALHMVISTVKWQDSSQYIWMYFPPKSSWFLQSWRCGTLTFCPPWKLCFSLFHPAQRLLPATRDAVMLAVRLLSQRTWAACQSFEKITFRTVPGRRRCSDILPPWGTCKDPEIFLRRSHYYWRFICNSGKHTCLVHHFLVWALTWHGFLTNKLES